MTSPRVSVVMSVYNGDHYLRDAIESILHQTFSDFEFIIIDDGSTDGTWAILTDYDDPRIRVVKNDVNLGLVRSLNKGLALARGEYIARMDADDISLSERLDKQVQFMDRNPVIGVLGTDIELINEFGTAYNEFKPPSIPTQSRAVNWTLFFRCCIHHPTVVARRTVLECLGGYSLDFAHAEDYEFWLRAIFKTKIMNLPDVLLKLRKHDRNVTKLYQETQQRNAEIAVRNAMSKALERDVDIKDVRILRDLSLITNARESLDTARLVRALFGFCITQEEISISEKQFIRDHAMSIFRVLGRMSAKQNPLVFLRLLKHGFNVIFFSILN